MTGTSSAQPQPRRPWPQWLAGLLLVGAVILAYQPAWNAGFIWDDDAYVTHNALLTAPDGLQRIWFSKESPSQYFPLTYTNFRVQRSLWGLDPAGYHWTNILLHAANALLVWRLLRRLAIPGAWLAASLFALHPVNVESVAWITELKNVQSFFFFLLALLAWIRWIDEPRRRWWYVMALVWYLLALFSKTTACTLPAALLLVLWLQRKPINISRLVQVAPFVLLGIAMGLVTIWWERHQQGTDSQAFDLGWLERLLIASRAIWFYAGKLLWPADLTFSYPRWAIHPAEPLAYTWLAAGAAVCGLIAYARRFTGRGVEVALAFYVAMLSPLLGFVMLYTFHYTFVADHYQYVAMIGPAALAAAALSRWETRNAKLGLETSAPGQHGLAAGFRVSSFAFRISTMLSFFLLLTLGVLTWRQCGMYADAETLWRATLARNPHSFMALNNLGDVLLQKGRPDEAMRYFRETLRVTPDSAKARCNLGVALYETGQMDAAISEYRHALELQPDLAEAHKNLGDACLQLGRLDEALDHSRRAVALNPRFAEAHNNVGTVLLQTGHPDEAIPHLRQAVDLRPDHANALNNLGVALIQKGGAAEALALFEKAVALQPDFAEAHNNLGKLQLNAGNTREAIAHYDRALRLQPGDTEILCNLAWALSTSPDPSLRNAARAVELAQRADDLSSGQSPVALGTLAAAYANAGRFAEAIAAAQKALRLAESRSDTALAEMLRSQLQLHQAGAPMRERPAGRMKP